MVPAQSHKPDPVRLQEKPDDSKQLYSTEEVYEEILGKYSYHISKNRPGLNTELTLAEVLT